MTPQHKIWQYVPAKPKPPQVPTRLKAEVDGKAQQLIDEVLKPNNLKSQPADETLNYIADIYGRWYRHYYYFCSRYNSPGPYAISPFFEAKFARMEYAGGERFHLAYMRHTGQWFEVFRDLSLAECLAAITDNPLFHP